MRRHDRGRIENETYEIGPIRRLVWNGTSINAFEFRGDVTGRAEPVLVIADDWDVFLIAEQYPANWRELDSEELFNRLTAIAPGTRE